MRGLGTAVLHGATTAVVAMIAKTMADRKPERAFLAIFPGWGVAVVVHSPTTTCWSPRWSPRPFCLSSCHCWCLRFSNAAIVRHANGSAPGSTSISSYCTSSSRSTSRSRGSALTFANLRSRFDGQVVADMFCLLRLELELSVQAKARLIARGAGLEIPVDDDLDASLSEPKYLRRSIGPTGLLALKPLQVTSHRDDWHRFMLSQAGVRARIKRKVQHPRRTD